jgi:hypothetical protein
MTSGSSPPPPADERTSAAPEAAARVTIAQVAASALAAVTATVTLSWLGSVGTIVGAAIASVVTVVGNAVYTRSIRHTQDRVLTLRQTILPPASGSVPSTASPTVPHPEPATEFSPTPGATRLQWPWLWPRLVARYGRTRMLVAVTVLLFVGILATVTVVELAAGKPLSDLLRGRPATGTSLFDGGTNGGSPSRHPTPTGTISNTGSSPVSTGSPQPTTPTESTPSPTESAPSPTSATPNASSASTPSPTAATSP